MSVIEKQYANFSHHRARMMRTVMRLIGMKKSIERNMVLNGYKKVPDTIPVRLQRSCDISAVNVAGKTVWSIQRKDAVRATGVRHPEPIVLYFHGGAFLEGITKRHWSFINALTQAWDGTIVFPDYPLAPEHGYRTIQDFAMALYQDVLGWHPHSSVVLMGDSAGGGLALSIALQLRAQGAKLPIALILYSPWLDLSMSNPQLTKLEALDELLTVRGLKAAAAFYAQGAPLDDCLISPINGSFHNLCPIALFIGTHDLLYADAVCFKERFVQEAQAARPLAEIGIQASDQHKVQQTYRDLVFYEYPTMFHDWMLVPALPEAQDVIAQTITFWNALRS